MHYLYPSLWFIDNTISLHLKYNCQRSPMGDIAFLIIHKYLCKYVILRRRDDNVLCQVYFTTMLMSYNMELVPIVYGVCDQYRKVRLSDELVRAEYAVSLIFVFKSNIMNCVFIKRGVVCHKFDKPIRFMDTFYMFSKFTT